MRRSRPERAPGPIAVLVAAFTTAAFVAAVLMAAVFMAASLGAAPAAAATDLAPIDPSRTATTLVQTTLVPTSTGMGLRLEVFVNGVSTHLVEPFALGAGGHLFAKPSDLADVGIKVPGVPDPLAPIDLASLPGVTFTYDERAQSVDFRLADAARLAHVYDARSTGPRAATARSGWGAVANYSLFGTSTQKLSAIPHFSGANATLDARAFSPYGTVSQTGIVGDTVLSRQPSHHDGLGDDGLRLDSTYTLSNQARELTGRAGDTISGGLAWTRPIRFGGLQLQRDFGLRPDLVTQPLPNVSGSAAVPSTVDVFVNSVKAYSQDVAPGPYTLTNLPVVSGGTAHVVVTDATGRSSDTAVPFFSAPNLLAGGLSDVSLDAGFARRNYGLLSDDYDKRPLGSAIGRYGFSDWLTLEGHGEGGAGLVNGGAGALASAGRWGTFSLALSGSQTTKGSRVGRHTGAQIYAGYDLTIAGFNLDASTQRTLATFDDLAAVTATASVLPSLAGAFATGTYSLDPRPPRALDRITVSVPLHFDPASLSASLINLVEADGRRSRIVTASLTRPLPFDASFFATGFLDLSQRGGAGVYAGVSFPLGPRVRASLGGSLGESGRQAQVDVGQSFEPTDGSVEWRLRDLEGPTPIRLADAGYRSPYGTAQVEVTQQGRTIGMQGELDGSFGYIAEGGAFAGNHVTDGFAVVDTGVAGVPVTRDNRLVGVTDMWGKLVVPDLQSYQGNQIGIDPLSLPANAEARSTHQTVTPAGRSGVGLTFGVDAHVDAATVKLQDAAGRPVPVGTKGHREGEAEAFVVGYEGQAYVKHLREANTVILDLGDHDCRATFPYRPTPGHHVAIGPVPCL